MARKCTICGKKPLAGNTRSHSNIATKVRRHPNLQKVKYQGKRILACTKCMKKAL